MAMKCKNARILISALVDGELSQREERDLRRHLRKCSECAREHAEVSNLRDVMAVWTDEEPSDWLAQNFAYRLRDEMERKPARRARKPRRVFGTAVAGFATALLAFGVIMHSQLAPQDAVPTKPPTVTQQAEPSVPPKKTDNAEPAKPDAARTERPVVADPRLAAPRADAGMARAPVKTSVRTKPPTRTVAPPTRVRTVGTTATTSEPGPLGGRIAAANTSGSTRTRPDLGARGATGREAEVKRMVMRSIMRASRAEGNSESELSNQLAKADLSMSESVEEVRGVLRKAVDVLARSENGIDPTKDF